MDRTAHPADGVADALRRIIDRPRERITPLQLQLAQPNPPQPMHLRLRRHRVIRRIRIRHQRRHRSKVRNRPLVIQRHLERLTLLQTLVSVQHSIHALQLVTHHPRRRRNINVRAARQLDRHRHRIAHAAHSCDVPALAPPRVPRAAPSAPCSRSQTPSLKSSAQPPPVAPYM